MRISDWSSDVCSSDLGTLRLKEDDKGLAVEIDLPDTSDGRDVATLIQRGDVSGMSFGFRVTHHEWDENVDQPVRTFRAVDMRQVSVVYAHAYKGTSITLAYLAARSKKGHGGEKGVRECKVRG